MRQRVKFHCLNYRSSCDSLPVYFCQVDYCPAFKPDEWLGDCLDRLWNAQSLYPYWPSLDECPF